MGMGCFKWRGELLDRQSSARKMAYVPPHRRRQAAPAVVVTLDDVRPDDSISCVASDEPMLDVTELSEQQVARVLTALGLGRYADACLSVPLRGKDLVHCRDEDLESIGISFRPHRVSLLEEVDRFRREGVPGALLEVCPPQTKAAADDVKAPASAPTVDIGDDTASETPTWLVQASHQLSQTPDAALAPAVLPTSTPVAASPAPAVPPVTASAVRMAPTTLPAAAAPTAPAALASSATTAPSPVSTFAEQPPPTQLEQLVESLQGMRTSSGVSGSTDLLNRPLTDRSAVLVG